MPSGLVTWRSTGCCPGTEPVLVELVADLAHDRLDHLEIEHEPEARKRRGDLDEDAVVVPVQALRRSVGEDQENGRRRT
jgi:hypothetical protein